MQEKHRGDLPDVRRKRSFVMRGEKSLSVFLFFCWQLSKNVRKWTLLVISISSVREGLLGLCNVKGNRLFSESVGQPKIKLCYCYLFDKTKSLDITTSIAKATAFLSSFVQPQLRSLYRFWLITMIKFVSISFHSLSLTLFSLVQLEMLSLKYGSEILGCFLLFLASFFFLSF